MSDLPSPIDDNVVMWIRWWIFFFRRSFLGELSRWVTEVEIILVEHIVVHYPRYIIWVNPLESEREGVHCIPLKIWEGVQSIICTTLLLLLLFFFLLLLLSEKIEGKIEKFLRKS